MSAVWRRLACGRRVGLWPLRWGGLRVSSNYTGAAYWATPAPVDWLNGERRSFSQASFVRVVMISDYKSKKCWNSISNKIMRLFDSSDSILYL